MRIHRISMKRGVDIQKTKIIESVYKIAILNYVYVCKMRTGKTREGEGVGDGGGEEKEEGTRAPHRCVSVVN